MAIRSKGERPRTRFTTTLDAHCLEQLKAHCKENGLSLSMVLDMLITDYLNGDTQNKGANVIANMLANPMVVNLVLEVIFPELKRKVAELEDAFKEAREKPE